MVPKVHRQYSTRRVLTMDLLPGVHLTDYVALSPSQEERDAYAAKILRAWYRLFFAGQMHYIDWHPGNFLFHNGSLGLIDFGCVMEMRGYEWELMAQLDRAMQAGGREDIAQFVKTWCDIPDELAERERFEEIVAYTQHIWKPHHVTGVYDYSDAEDWRTTLRMVGELTQKRYTRGHRTGLLNLRWEFAYRTTMYRLGAKVDVHTLRDEEVKATGWAHV